MGELRAVAVMECGSAEEFEDFPQVEEVQEDFWAERRAAPPPCSQRFFLSLWTT